jgi:hypothetical protein
MLCPDHVSKKLLCDSGPSQSDTAANESNHRPAWRLQFPIACIKLKI